MTLSGLPTMKPPQSTQTELSSRNWDAVTSFRHVGRFGFAGRPKFRRWGSEGGSASFPPSLMPEVWFGR